MQTLIWYFEADGEKENCLTHHSKNLKRAAEVFQVSEESEKQQLDNKRLVLLNADKVINNAKSCFSSHTPTQHVEVQEHAFEGNVSLLRLMAMSSVMEKQKQLKAHLINMQTLYRADGCNLKLLHPSWTHLRQITSQIAYCHIAVGVISPKLFSGMLEYMKADCWMQWMMGNLNQRFKPWHNHGTLLEAFNGWGHYG